MRRANSIRLLWTVTIFNSLCILGLAMMAHAEALRQESIGAEHKKLLERLEVLLEKREALGR